MAGVEREPEEPSGWLVALIVAALVVAVALVAGPVVISLLYVPRP